MIFFMPLSIVKTFALVFGRVGVGDLTNQVLDALSFQLIHPLSNLPFCFWLHHFAREVFVLFLSGSGKYVLVLRF